MPRSPARPTAHGLSPLSRNAMAARIHGSTPTSSRLRTSTLRVARFARDSHAERSDSVRCARSCHPGRCHTVTRSSKRVRERADLFRRRLKCGALEIIRLCRQHGRPITTAVVAANILRRRIGTARQRAERSLRTQAASSANSLVGAAMWRAATRDHRRNSDRRKLTRGPMADPDRPERAPRRPSRRPIVATPTIRPRGRLQLPSSSTPR